MFDKTLPTQSTDRDATPPRYGFENASLIIDQLRRNGTSATADALDAFVRQELGHPAK